MSDFLSADKQLAILMDGIDTVVPAEGLRELLELKRPLRVKLGVDPTAPDVTLGWAVVFRLLRQFQELGHIAVLIVGDFTAQVGDPSGKSDTRRRLDRNEVGDYVSETLETIKAQLLEDRLEVRHNSEWLRELDMGDVLELASHFTVSRIMDRDDFRTRWEAHEPISLIEFMYPLLQAFDSVAVNADIELGGSDQLFNNLVGRHLQSRMGQSPQVVMTVPLLVGLDGIKKMSQSLGNYISVTDEPAEMFGKTMSIPDHAMKRWFVLAAGWTEAATADMMERISGGGLPPVEAKRALARSIVVAYWGQEAAHDAEAAFDRVFKRKGTPDDIAEVVFDSSTDVYLPLLLESAGLVSSRSEARRLIKQGAVKIGGAKTEGESVSVETLAGQVVQVGKRRFFRAVPGEAHTAGSDLEASIEEIEGIGPAYAEKLRDAGVKTCEALLERGASKKGRNELAEATGFSTGTLLEWVNRADLMRVRGVGSEYSALEASIEEIEGIGPAYAEKLRDAGVKTCEALLERGASKKGRNELAEATGFSTGTLLEWVNRADLMRVRGVGSEYSPLLEAAGVDTVKELRNRNPANLTEKMGEVNTASTEMIGKTIVRQLPTESMVVSWVAHAKELQPAVTH